MGSESIYFMLQALAIAINTGFRDYIRAKYPINRWLINPELILEWSHEINCKTDPVISFLIASGSSRCPYTGYRE